MRPYKITATLAAVDPDGLADGNSSAGATVTLDGALTSGGSFTSSDNLGRRISILDLGADDQTGATYTITGTDVDGNALTEDIAGPGASATVTTTNYFLTITSIAIASPAAGSTVDIGTVDEAVTPTFPLDYIIRPFEVSLAVDVTGTINYTVEHTFEKVQELSYASWKWWDHESLVSQTADADSNYAFPATATRLKVNSFSSGATAVFYVIQGHGGA